MAASHAHVPSLTGSTPEGALDRRLASYPDGVGGEACQWKKNRPSIDFQEKKKVPFLQPLCQHSLGCKVPVKGNGPRILNKKQYKLIHCLSHVVNRTSGACRVGYRLLRIGYIAKELPVSLLLFNMYFFICQRITKMQFLKSARQGGGGGVYWAWNYMTVFIFSLPYDDNTLL